MYIIQCLICEFTPAKIIFHTRSSWSIHATVIVSSRPYGCALSPKKILLFIFCQISKLGGCSTTARAIHLNNKYMLYKLKSWCSSCVLMEVSVYILGVLSRPIRWVAVSVSRVDVYLQILSSLTVWCSSEYRIKRNIYDHIFFNLLTLSSSFLKYLTICVTCFCFPPSDFLPPIFFLLVIFDVKFEKLFRTI